MALPEQIKCVLFDLDGVLVDAADWHKEAFDFAISTFGCAPLDYAEHLRIFNGLSTRKKLDILAEQGKIKADNSIKNTIHKIKQNITVDIINRNCKPDKRVIGVVDFAKIMVGHIGLVTNCSRHTCELMLEKSDLADKFGVIVTNEDVDGKIKPHPRPYCMGYQYFGCLPQEVLAIDDSPKGIKSALDAGCHVWDLHKFNDLTVDNLQKYLNTILYI